MTTVNTISVTAFTASILELIKVNLPSVDIWTYGPSRHFKNKYVFVLRIRFQRHQNIRLQWNYCATIHGKGPNDGLGCTVERMARRFIMARTVILTNAKTFAAAMRLCDTDIQVMVMDEKAILNRCDTDTLWNVLQTCQGTISTHFLVQVDMKSVRLKCYTGAT